MIWVWFLTDFLEPSKILNKLNHWSDFLVNLNFDLQLYIPHRKSCIYPKSSLWEPWLLFSTIKQQTFKLGKFLRYAKVQIEALWTCKHAYMPDTHLTELSHTENLMQLPIILIHVQGVYKTKPTKFQDFSRISRSFLNSFPGFVCTKCLPK